MDVSEIVRNNARWCDAVCRSHGIAGSFSSDAWVSPRRTPPLYPDAVTLRPGVDPGHLLRLVDASRGCSIKDSFADLDLGAAGFTVLFRAWWVVCEPGARRSSSSWVTVTDEATFRRWEHQWIAHGGAPHVLLPALMIEPGVTVLADVRAGDVLAGAIAYRTGAVVGLTNTFACDGDGWRDAVAARHPGGTIVGYEPEDALTRGVVPIAPLQVWTKDA